MYKENNVFNVIAFTKKINSQIAYFSPAMIAEIVFTITLFMELLVAAGLIISLFYTDNRIWPPLKKDSWQYTYTQFLSKSSFLSFFILGFLDMQSFILRSWLFILFGFILMITGAALYFWASLTFQKTYAKTQLEALSELSEKRMMFDLFFETKDKLVTEGPYKYSRNPQYLGTILFFLGAILVFNSSYQVITGFLGFTLLILAVFVEESWLKLKFKDKYDEYCKEVHRFI
jgi:protein-S-isoprenylcysteine O-methyltransferase Ste14